MTSSRSTGLSRRGFMKGALSLTGAAAFGTAGLSAVSQLAHAQNHPDVPDRYYIFCYFDGAWDILLGLDPRDPRRFNNGNLRTTRIQPGYEQLLSGDGQLRITRQGQIFGPHIGGLRDLIDDGTVSVVRGMSMDTLTHEVGRRRFLTGKPPAGLQARGSNASVWLASKLGQSQTIPNLSLQVEGYNADQPSYASPLRVNTVADLLRALRPQEPLLGWRTAGQVGDHQRAAADCAPARASRFWQAAEQGRVKANEMVNADLDSMFDFGARNAQMESLRGRYGFNNVNTDPEVQAAFAARAIMGGVSRCVSIRVASGLDTHFNDWQRDQGPRQERGFNAVSRLIEDLRSTEYRRTGRTWLDHTTIVGFSEFSRTAMLNGNTGRDHSLTNACFIAGGGIQGGRILGASSDVGMSPQKIDLNTGRVSQDGEIVRPEHILQTLFDEVGIGEAPDLRVTGIAALNR